jgi:hypothetical protein
LYLAESYGPALISSLQGRIILIKWNRLPLYASKTAEEELVRALLVEARVAVARGQARDSPN